MPEPGSGFWSLDAWVMVRPAAAFRSSAARPRHDGAWMACRRPLFVAFVLGCVASLMASGTLTPRLAIPPAVYWAYVPAVEALALVAVTWRRRHRVGVATAIDTFFTGHAVWTLFLIGVAATMAFLPPEFGWGRIRMLIGCALFVIAWSAYIDFWFFRTVLGASRAAAIRDVVVCRALTWTVVFTVFAVPDPRPWAIGREIVEAVREVMR